VDIVAVLGLSVMTDTKVSKQSEIEKGYLRCGPSFSRERKSLKTSPLKELETILPMWVWFKQARTTNASIDGPHLKEEAVHVAARLGMSSFRASKGWINCFQKRHNLVYKTVSGESAVVNPEIGMD